MRIDVQKAMVFGNKGRLREMWAGEWTGFLAYHRSSIEGCGGWDWIKSHLLSLILWWIDQNPREAEVWMKRYIAIRDLE